jgi:adenosylmethionine-8-amino-7-oxononanoate aminotransferase
MVRAEGCRLFDAHGRSYLVGHGRAEIAEAMAKQTRELAYVCAASYTNLAAVRPANRGAGAAHSG